MITDQQRKEFDAIMAGRASHHIHLKEASRAEKPARSLQEQFDAIMRGEPFQPNPVEKPRDVISDKERDVVVRVARGLNKLQDAERREKAAAQRRESDTVVKVAEAYKKL